MAPPTIEDVLEEDPTFANVETPLADALFALLGSPGIASKRWVIEQYDFLVQGGTVGQPGADAAVIRLNNTLKALAFMYVVELRAQLGAPVEVDLAVNATPAPFASEDSVYRAILGLLEKDADLSKTLVYFMGIDEAKFRRPIVPGDQMRIVVEVIRRKAIVWKMKGEVYVGSELAAEATLLSSIGQQP